MAQSSKNSHQKLLPITPAAGRYSLQLWWHYGARRLRFHAMTETALITGVAWFLAVLDAPPPCMKLPFSLAGFQRWLRLLGAPSRNARAPCRLPPGRRCRPGARAFGEGAGPAPQTRPDAWERLAIGPGAWRCFLDVSPLSGGWHVGSDLAPPMSLGITSGSAGWTPAIGVANISTSWLTGGMQSRQMAGI